LPLTLSDQTVILDDWRQTDSEEQDAQQQLRSAVNLAQTRVYVLCHATTIMSPALTDVLLIVPFLSLPPLFGIVCLAISVAHLPFHLS